MKDDKIVRLQKQDKGLKPLPYVVWTDAASIPRPEDIGPFDGTKTYSKNDVISYGSDVLLYCKHEPEVGYSRPGMAGANLPGSYDMESRIFEYGDSLYLLTTQSPKALQLDPFTDFAPTAGQTVYILEWSPQNGATTLIDSIPGAALSSVDFFVYDNRFYITGGIDKDSNLTTSKIWEFDGSELKEVTSFKYSNITYRYSLGTREFIITHDVSEKQIQLQQFVPEISAVNEVTTIEIDVAQTVAGVTHQIHRGTTYIFVSLYDYTRAKTDIVIYRFDNVSKSLRLENTVSIQDQLLSIEAKEINQEYFVIVSGVNDFVSVHQFLPESKSLIERSKVPKVFDHQGYDTDISGLVFTYSFFTDDDVLYMNLPIYKNGDTHECLSVTCTWEPNTQTFIPFKGLDTQGAYSWHLHQTETDLFAVLTNHIKDNGTTGKTKILGWDATTKKFTASFDEIAGGSLWNKDDWEELMVATAIVRPYSPNLDYVTDMYILNDDDEVLRLKRPANEFMYDPDDWEIIHPKQRISTMHFYPGYNRTIANPTWGRGVLVPIRY